MILWTLISIALIALSVREFRNSSVGIWDTLKNPGWAYLSGLWFIGSAVLYAVAVVK